MHLRTLKDHSTQRRKPVWPSSKSHDTMKYYFSAAFLFQMHLKRKGVAPCLFQVAQFNRNVDENRGGGCSGKWEREGGMGAVFFSSKIENVEPPSGTISLHTPMRVYGATSWGCPPD